MFLLLSRFCDLIDLTGPKHLKEVTHVDEFDIPGFSCEPVGGHQNQPCFRMLFGKAVESGLVLGLNIIGGFYLNRHFGVTEDGIYLNV